MTQVNDSAPGQSGSLHRASAAARDAVPETGIRSSAAFSRLLDARVMMIDDEPVLIEVIRGFLEDAGYRNFASSTDPAAALAQLATDRPEVLLLDVVMPRVSGLDILHAMAGNPQLCDVPVIVLTASSEPSVKLQALEMGAADFLAKPVDPSELVLRLRNTLAAKAYRDRLAYFDPVTGLPNRRMFQERLQWACDHARRYSGRAAVLHLGMDRFQGVNEALGPGAADRVLKQIGERLSACVRESDAVARAPHPDVEPSVSLLGGDEFSVLLPTLDHAENAALVARRLLHVLSGTPFVSDGHEVLLFASIGIAVFPEDGDNPDSLIKHASVAARRARQEGGNRYQFYSRELNARAVQKLAIESGLRRALEREEMRLQFQPKYDARSGALLGAEALVRWQHPSRGLLGPGEFIELAEANGLIVPLGEWVLAAACHQAARWRQTGMGAQSMAVNVSALQLKSPKFVDTVARTLRVTGMAPESLCIELTESLILERNETTLNALRALHAMGIKLSIDDFGVGYTSLSHLRGKPFGELKIDKSFIDEIENDADSVAIVSAVIALAHTLGLKVVAEGVETQGQHEILRAKGCDVCQGYLFSRPLDAERYADLLRAQRATVQRPQRSLGDVRNPEGASAYFGKI